MSRDFASMIMNPVRQRIAQYLILNERGTVAEMARAMNDVPRASLYRHVNRMLEAGLICVVEERQTRGAVERTYALVQNPMGEQMGNADISLLIQGMLSGLQHSVVRYLARPDADPQRDGLALSSAVLMLSDEEYTELFQEIGRVYEKFLNNGPGDGRKARNIVWVTVPVDDEEDNKNVED